MDIYNKKCKFNKNIYCDNVEECNLKSFEECEEEALKNINSEDYDVD